MKKKFSFIVLLLFIIFLTGCGKMSQEEINNVKNDLIEYVKNNMDSSWSYEDGKISVDDDFNVSVKMYNTLDLSDCFLSAKGQFLSLKKNSNDKQYLKSVKLVCEYRNENIGYVLVDNIKELDETNYNSSVKLYNNSGLVTVNDDFFTKQKEDFISKTSKYSYKEIFRNSEKYVGNYAVFTGIVEQVLDENSFFSVRMNVTKDEYGYYDDTVFAFVPKEYFEGRILENDIVTVYGRLDELMTYQSIFGQDITVPFIRVRYAELVE